MGVEIMSWIKNLFAKKPPQEEPVNPGRRTFMGLLGAAAVVAATPIAFTARAVKSAIEMARERFRRGSKGKPRVDIWLNGTSGADTGDGLTSDAAIQTMGELSERIDNVDPETRYLVINLRGTVPLDKPMLAFECELPADDERPLILTDEGKPLVVWDGGDPEESDA
jgi:hypothetical protein